MLKTRKDEKIALEFCADGVSVYYIHSRYMRKETLCKNSGVSFEGLYSLATIDAMDVMNHNSVFELTCASYDDVSQVAKFEFSNGVAIERPLMRLAIDCIYDIEKYSDVTKWTIDEKKELVTLSKMSQKGSDHQLFKACIGFLDDFTFTTDGRTMLFVEKDFGIKQNLWFYRDAILNLSEGSIQVKRYEFTRYEEAVNIYAFVGADSIVFTETVDISPLLSAKTLADKKQYIKKFEGNDFSYLPAYKKLFPKNSAAITFKDKNMYIASISNLTSGEGYNTAYALNQNMPDMSIDPNYLSFLLESINFNKKKADKFKCVLSTLDKDGFYTNAILLEGASNISALLMTLRAD